MVISGNTSCGVFKWGVQNQKDFCLRVNISKQNFENWCSNKVISKLMLSKNVNEKNVLLNCYSSMKKR